MAQPLDRPERVSGEDDVSVFGPFPFIATDGRTFRAEVYIDPQKVAEWLVQRAQYQPDGIAKALGGAVMVQLERARK